MSDNRNDFVSSIPGIDLDAVRGLAGASPYDIAEPTGSLVVGVVTDVHYADLDSIGSRRPRDSYEKLLRALDHFKANGVNLILSLGDLVQPTGDKAADIESLEEICAPIKKFAAENEIMSYCVWGNHDFEAIDEADLWLHSGILSAPAAVSMYGSSIILLDLCYTSDSERYPRGEDNWLDCYMPEEELKWLERQLRLTEGDVTVFAHQKLDSGEPMREYSPSNVEDIRRVLEKFGNVKRVYSGHHHMGSHSVINGIEYTSLKAMCEESHTDVEDFCHIIRF